MLKIPLRVLPCLTTPTVKKADTDLYQFELYEAARPQAVTYVKATVIDADTKQPLVAKTDFIILPENKVHLKGSTDKAGEFLVCLPIGNDYALNVNKPGYLFHSENFALAGKATLEDPFLLEIELQRIPEATPDAAPIVSKPVILKNVFFDYGFCRLASRFVRRIGSTEKLTGRKCKYKNSDQWSYGQCWRR